MGSWVHGFRALVPDFRGLVRIRAEPDYDRGMPRRFSVLLISLAIVQSSAPVAAQTVARGPETLFVRTIQRSWNEAKRNLKESADLMPDADYGYRPVDSVRTFGAIIAHVAGANYVFCAAARGEKAPHEEDAFEKTAKTKAAIVKALADSLTYCDAAYSMASDMRIRETVTAPFTGSQENRAQVLLGNIGHVNEHYGNLVTYFRMKGMVPPSSRR
jgi:uncharacterized damage-inducible protein DinB